MSFIFLITLPFHKLAKAFFPSMFISEDWQMKLTRIIWKPKSKSIFQIMFKKVNCTVFP